MPTATSLEVLVVLSYLGDTLSSSVLWSGATTKWKPGVQYAS